MALAQVLWLPLLIIFKTKGARRLLGPAQALSLIPAPENCRF